MSEHAPHHPEVAKAPERETTPERHHVRHEHEATAEKHETKLDVRELQDRAKETALSGHEISSRQEDEQPAANYVGMHHKLKQDAYQHTLKKVRKHLPRSQKAISKLIHQPTVEVISEIGSKTTARPSGLVGAGATALLGSTVVLYFSKQHGFRYNFFVFIALLAVGFFAGIIIEFASKPLRNRK